MYLKNKNKSLDGVMSEYVLRGLDKSLKGRKYKGVESEKTKTAPKRGREKVKCPLRMNNSTLRCGYKGKVRKRYESLEA